MNIAYILESTALCGGVKVVFNHVSALTAKGHHAAVFSPAPYPLWVKNRVPFHMVDLKSFQETQFFHDADVIMATSPSHLLPLYHHISGKGCKKKLIHFVQGYEGDYAEAEPFMDMITQAYSLDVPKITVSESLCQRLGKIYPDNHFTACGQGLENDIFYPPENLLSQTVHGSSSGSGLHCVDSGPDSDSHSKVDFADCICKPSPYGKPVGKVNKDSAVEVDGVYDTVFLIGALNISIKRIGDGLSAFKMARERKENLKLIRVSAVDTRDMEEELAGKIHEYHVNLKPYEVGELFRSKRGILISPSSPGEGFGLPPLEGMACGIPAVLTDIPSYRAFSSPGDYALFVPMGAPDKMADALVEISEDQQLRSQLIKRGLDVAGEYSYSKVIETLEAFLSYA